jgi:hypothetical protein
VFTPVTEQATPWLDLAGAVALASPDLAAFGGVSPEKWEGLAIGPRLADVSHLVLAGTDNDYSVTQDDASVQHDVYIRPLAAGGVERIRCDIGTFSNCLLVDAKGKAGAAVPAGYDFGGYRLIPGVLHAYKASLADLLGYRAPRRGGN